MNSDEFKPISKAKEISVTTPNLNHNNKTPGLEQRHEENSTHYHTKLFIRQSKIGYVDVMVEAEEIVNNKRKATGYLTLYPEQARKLASQLNEYADAAQQDRENSEYHVQELPDPQ